MPKALDFKEKAWARHHRVKRSILICRRSRMHRSRLLFVLAGPILIVGAQLVFMILLARPQGARIRSPQESFTVDRTFVIAGDAWKKGGIAAIAVDARCIDRVDVGKLGFAATRDAVKYRGAVLFRLSTWSAKAELPVEGRWELQVVVLGNDGREIRSPVRSVQVVASTPIREFRSWTTEHLAPIAVIVVISFTLGLLARRRGYYDRIAIVVSLVLWTNELVYQVYWFLADGWAAPTALMIQMCGLSILLLPLAHFVQRREARQFLFDILYFWGIGGAIQALFSPDIGANGFPAFKYFSFFVSHGLIIASTTILAIASGMRITFRSLLRAAVVTNLLLVPAYAIDRVLAFIPPYDRGNYFVLGYPPPTGSLVDVFSDIFGPSPRYLVGLELMGLAVFLMLWLPWILARGALKSGNR
jgi:hypothetical integral membrane protein (TIGR02206 family)